MASSPVIDNGNRACLGPNLLPLPFREGGRGTSRGGSPRANDNASGELPPHINGD